MSSKQSPAKVPLSMIKGKPITMSVPVFRYHASDDELEELYPSEDDEKQTPDSEKTSPKPSPRKSRISISDDGDSFRGMFEKDSTTVDENLSEGTPPSDPWKVLSDFKGKITKTFEDKLSEMKNERRKSKPGRSRDTSSISDYEDLGDVTPTEENGSEKQEKNNSSPKLRKRTNSSRFVGFSYIKTGLKTKKESEEDSVESGIEAAELTYDCQTVESEIVDSIFESESSNHNVNNVNVLLRVQQNLRYFLPEIMKSSDAAMSETDYLFIQLKNRIYYYLLALIVILCFCYLIPLPKYFMGILAGISVSVILQKIYTNFNQLLTIPAKIIVPVLEIPAVEEQVVVEKFEGWLNELPYKYEPDNYHVARTKAVFFKLEREILHVMETKNKIPKRAIWDEPKHKPKFTKKRVYNLSGAKIELLPTGLIRRRRWSKKYPICITVERSTWKENTILDNSSDEEVQPLENIENDKVILEEEETDDDYSQSKDSKDIFEDCQEGSDDEEMKVKLYIFARTDRQKEDWFRRLVTASEYDSKRSSISSLKDFPLSSNSSPQTNNEAKPPTPSAILTESSSILSYQAYMARYIEVPVEPTVEHNYSGISHDGLWINALFGRILFDMHKCPETINVIQDKIQRKLSNIKLPYFMESLLVSEVVIGQGAPIVHKASKPVIDERGLWFDLDITYEGSLTMTIETKLNLMKLKRAGSATSNSTEILGVDKTQPARSPMFDSDVEDSPETSTEDEDSAPLTAATSSRENTPTQSSGRKFLSMVDKLASNKYFQHATELSYVKRAMEGVSNTEIRLMVSVSSIEGCLAVNIPPPPSDRLWYGFRPIPKINLTAKPAVGERALNIVYVTKWIETKLLREFEKIVVIPNMDDLMIPLCPNYPYS